MASLEDRLDSNAEAWKPNPGDTLVGEVVDVDTHDAGYGSYPIVTVRTDDGGEVAIHGFHTVLKREFAKARPEIGSRIGVKYLGPTRRATSRTRSPATSLHRRSTGMRWLRESVARPSSRLSATTRPTRSRPSRLRRGPRTMTSRSRSSRGRRLGHYGHENKGIGEAIAALRKRTGPPSESDRPRIRAMFGSKEKPIPGRLDLAGSVYGDPGDDRAV